MTVVKRSRSQLLIYLTVTLIVMGPSPTSAQDTNSADGEQKPFGIIYFPIIFSTPETGFAVGSSIGLFYRPAGAAAETRPSMISLLGIYTRKKQVVTQLGMDAYLLDGKYHVIMSVEYKKFPDKIWGVGNDMPDTAEESFTARRGMLSLDFQRRIGSGLNIGLQYVFARSRIVEVEENGLLDTGSVPGATGSRISGAGLIVNWDTRDNIFYPLSGRWYQLSMRFYGNGLGSDFSYNRYNLDLREYVPLGPEQTLAFQLFGLFVTGRPPFDSMSRLGGERIMRGYYTGRYLDRNMLALQAEYRRPLWRRLGMVVFAGAGDVAHEIGDFRPGDFKYSAGFGFRFPLIQEEKMNLRLDWAWGKGTSGMYITVMEAF